MELLMEHMGRGIVLMLILSMPSVFVAASIGLVVGIIQAVTSVQEQTIAAAPKILGVFMIIMIMSGFSMNQLDQFFRESSNIAFNIIPRSEENILPPSGFYKSGSKIYDEEYFGEDKPTVKQSMKNPGKLPLHDEKYKQSYTKMPKNIAYPPNFIESRKIQSGK